MAVESAPPETAARKTVPLGQPSKAALTEASKEFIKINYGNL
jgi:hypothetical protein